MTNIISCDKRLIKLIIAVSKKSSKSHKDIRYFKAASLKVISNSITFKYISIESDFNIEVKLFVDFKIRSKL